MKNRMITMVCLLCGQLVSFGQGYFVFDNFSGSSGSAPVTISGVPGTYNLADGPAGAYLGSDYTASLYFVNGTVTDQAVFDSSDPMLFSPADVQFYGITGPQTNGSGFFEGGEVYLSAATGYDVTVEVRAWYNGDGAYTSYAQALAAGQNVGESEPVALTLADPTSPDRTLDGLLPFTVGIIPEPSELALFGLGGLSLWLFRRRDQSPKSNVQSAKSGSSARQ